jgi:NADH-quinone oxidoreductase subunit L
MPDIFQGHELLLALTVLLIPLVSFVIMTLMKGRSERTLGSIATTLSGITFLIALILSLNLIIGDNVYQQIQWFALGAELTFNVGVFLDELTGVMLTVVTFIAFMVHLFSKNYMSGDKEYGRYFGLLGLFTFSMLGIVIADNLLLLFIFWELVGFSSYLLIGFWYEKPSAIKASKKAFIVNRIGDLGFVIAIMIFWTEYGTVDFSILHQVGYRDSFWVGVAGLGLLGGVMGKSAQFPLQVWLPDAMEGPTPVSALIHAATMVAAGIFLLARVFVLLSPQVLDVITVIGAITAFMGAIAAIRQYDIKKVLAFSTISQLGYMVMGIGVGATGGAVFHLVTHAFFKACLFLSAGAVIHWMHQQDNHKTNDQDMRSMGGLRKYLPIVFVTFLISAMSLAGLPLMSGFLSKDAILTGVYQWTLDHSHYGFVAILVMTLAFGSVLLTGYYMTRQVILVFVGEVRSKLSNESKRLPMGMTIPLILLATGATWLLFSTNPMDPTSSWLMTLFSSDFEQAIPHNIHSMVFKIALILSLLGIGLSYMKFRKYVETKSSVGLTSIVNQISTNNWYLDKIYDVTFVNAMLKLSSFARMMEVHLIDRIVNYIGIFQVILSRVIGWSDRHVVDGIVHLTTSAVYGVGKIAKSAQGDNAQRYIMTALISIIFIAGGLAFYFFKY